MSSIGEADLVYVVITSQFMLVIMTNIAPRPPAVLPPHPLTESSQSEERGGSSDQSEEKGGRWRQSDHRQPDWLRLRQCAVGSGRVMAV